MSYLEDRKKDIKDNIKEYEDKADKFKQNIDGMRNALNQVKINIIEEKARLEELNRIEE
jgi:prefoldin subunit 5